ncbi:MULTISPECIES: threonine/serine exporter family protein [Staphylococcus]|uniref:Threonine/serine exporter n=1 Tax=Staphylococcus shinii TaxID=2912228 RepID=A0A418IE08_9STAP|nr:threonine/serine exporter family protein [Staphylococcus shinii]MBO3065595.1 threonine/serine exporter family protein [Staphylococcus shinii]MDW8565702.1 threonine/serine exporter family protein [Staphylococcus shinii]MDW8566207.1 threonine/serine exporter family protein [Staphylococcus shinii]MDW8569129.1 threonine/serine exporter family protein [Staphylococcus shinii]MEC5300803.1 threonine/serine exporter family protein [Staphylococcus shinii]
MTFMYTLFFSFTASYFFALIYDAPKKLFLPAGLAGALGYIINFTLNTSFQMDSIYTSLLGSLTLGLISHIMSRLFKSPVVVFMIPGIIPLVPGSLAFRAMQQLVTLNFTDASNTFIRTILIAGSIALGLIISDQLSKTLNIRKFMKIKRNQL